MHIGRQSELVRLEHTLLRAAGSAGAAAFVTGEAGMGKTRLVDEFRAAHPDVRTLIGGCLPIESIAVPYAPFAAALRMLQDGHGRLPADVVPRQEARWLAGVIPDLTRHSPSTAPAATVHEGLRRLLGRVAAQSSTILALEDLHWAGEGALSALAYLLADIPAGLMVIVTARRGELERPAERLLAEVSRRAEVEVLDLIPLTRSEVMQQARQITQMPLTPAAADDLHLRSAGIPFYVEELLAAQAQRRGSDSIHGALVFRANDAGPDARRLCELLAVAGGPLLPSTLRRASRIGVRRFSDAFEIVVRRHLVVADGGSPALRLRHPLLADALVASMSVSARRERRRCLAVAMQGDGRSPAGAVAAHWLAAGEPSEALPYLLRAAREGRVRSAHVESRSLYERALEVIRTAGGPSSPETEVCEELAETCVVLDDLKSADAYFSQAIATASARDQERRWLLMARQAQWRWRFDETGAIFQRRQVADFVAKRWRRLRSAALLSAGVRALVGEHRLAEALRLGTIALRRAERAGLTEIQSEAMASIGLTKIFTGDADEGLSLLAEAAEIAAAHGHISQFELASGNHVSALGDLGRGRSVAAACGRWAKLAERMGLLRTVRDMELVLASYLMWTGKWESASSHVPAYRDLDDVQSLNVMHLEARLAIRQGRLDGAETLVRQLESRAGRLIQPATVAEPYTVRAELELARGDLRAAERTVDAGLAAVESGGPGAGSALIMAELISLAAQAVMLAPAREGAARTRMARRLVRMRRFMHPGAGRPVFGVQLLRAYRLEISAALAPQDDVSTARRWSLAAEAWEGLGNLPAAHRAWMESASKWHARADRRAGHAALAAAWRCAQDIESTKPREDTISFASTHSIALHGHARGHPAEGWSTLTAREREVLVLIASGRTNRQIANSLFITEKTVGIHVSNVLGKLGVARRTEAAMVAMRAGLSPPSVSDLRSRLRQRGSAHRSGGI